MSGSGDGAFQYVPLDKIKLYQNNTLFNTHLRKMNFSTKFDLVEVLGTDSVDIDIGTEIQSLGDLVDVAIVAPIAKQVLRHDGTEWINANLALDDLGDATITTPQTGQGLRYDGTNWVNAFPFFDDLVDAIISNPQAQQVIRHNGISWLNAFLSSSDLSDIEITAPTTGQVIRYDGTNFVNVAASAIALLLNDLTDVIITSATNGQFLGYDGSNWVNTLIALDALSDVVIGSLASGQTLQYDGTNWVNVLAALDYLTDVVITSPTNGQVLQYNGTSWVNATPTPGLVNLDDLGDVAVIAPSAGHVIRYSGTDWVNVALAELISLNQLSDVSLSGTTSGDVLTFSGGAWINQAPSGGGGGGGANALTDLSDVSITSPDVGDILRHNGTAWVDIPIAELVSLTQLSDVAITSPTTAQVPRYNGTSWVNSLLNIDDLTPVTITTPANGQQLVFNGTNWVNQTIAQASNVSFLPDTINNGSNWGLWTGGARAGTGLFADCSIEGSVSSRQDASTSGKATTVFVTGPNNDDVAGFHGSSPTQAGFYVRRDQNFHYKQRIQFASFTEMRAAWGLAALGILPGNTATFLGSGVAGFLFRVESGVDSTYQLFRNDTSGTAVQVNTGIAAQVAVPVTFEIFGDATNNRIGWAINEATTTWYTTDIPEATTSLNYHTRIEAKAGGARSLIQYYAYITQDPS